jgi:hypothetical protein
LGQKLKANNGTSPKPPLPIARSGLRGESGLSRGERSLSSRRTLWLGHKALVQQDLYMSRFYIVRRRKQMNRNFNFNFKRFSNLQDCIWGVKSLVPGPGAVFNPNVNQVR